MQLDTTKKGLEAIFEPWQVPLVDELFERDIKSGEAHKFLENKGIKTHPDAKNTVSRASVIGFLNHLVDEELLSYTEVSGKGGFGKKYKMTHTREAFNHRIIDLFVDTLRTAFPKEMRP